MRAPIGQELTAPGHQWSRLLRLQPLCRHKALKKLLLPRVDHVPNGHCRWTSILSNSTPFSAMPQSVVKTLTKPYSSLKT